MHVTSTTNSTDALRAEVERRRTFAIISHPDAGKTTLTEKLLLYAGAIELAGAVRGRKTERHVVSDWMDIERERGISVTSAAVEFELGPYRLTLLDTPGHKDFSEDTYRTLFAVDGVVMVIDGAKGIESQTRKLYEVCRLRRLPVLTFVNKMDQPSRDPFDLLDEIERVLGLHAVPMNWPIGSGDRFRGVFDLQNGEVHLYGSKGRAHPAPVEVGSPQDPRLAEMLGADAWQHLIDETSLVIGAGTTFDKEAYLTGRHTPVFFGSALSSFGLEPFLKALTELAPPPTPRESDHGAIPPECAQLQRLRVQDPGEHEPPSPRSRGVRAGLLRRAREGHGADQRAARVGDSRGATVSILRRQAGDHRARLSRRRRRPGQSRGSSELETRCTRARR